MKIDKKSCFLCLEKTIMKRSKCCRELETFDFYNAYIISNQLNRLNLSRVNILCGLSKRLKNIGKCSLAMAKYKTRLKICGANISYRLQRFYKNLRKKYYLNVQVPIFYSKNKSKSKLFEN